MEKEWSLYIKILKISIVKSQVNSQILNLDFGGWGLKSQRRSQEHVTDMNISQKLRNSIHSFFFDFGGFEENIWNGLLA